MSKNKSKKTANTSVLAVFGTTMKQIGYAIAAIKKGKIGVMPTDTLYGLIGSARSKKAVNAIYRVKKRNSKKPLIVLIGSKKELTNFGIKLDKATEKIIRRFWPGPVSIILPCKSKQYAYIHQGTSHIAFRLPKPSWLRRLLGKTGPLVAPSANPEGKEPARTAKEAQAYFGDKVSFYMDKGKSGTRASKLIQITGDTYRILRQK